MLLLGIQGVFSGSGGGAEPSRTLAVASAQEKGGRVAIVIGNSNYPSGALTNPKNDATAMAASLKKLGFDVELKLDASKADIDGMLRRFSGKAEKATVAALFYAGHGIQVGGSNYLVPIDANPRNERDLKRDMVKMDDVIDDMGDARVKLVFFDACRDNPLSRSFSRGGSRGMAAPVEATGTLISFATKHGNTAADGDGRHSPYTASLLAALENPGGVEIEQLLRRVQQGVKAETKGQQEPWRYGSLDGDFYFKAADPADNSKVPQEAVEKAVLDAMRRTNEQAAKEKAELQKSMKAQQEASERAMAEALRKANEQAARDRAEMQASMEKMLKEALARQNAAMEAERAARLAAGESVKEPVAARPAAASAGIDISRKPIQLALIAPTNPGGGSGPSTQTLAAVSSAPGDEWEYVSRDNFGKIQKVLGRVKAVVPGTGVLEEYLVDGKSSGEWVFDGKPSLIGIPIDAVLMFAPYWSGDKIDSPAVLNGSKYVVQAVSGKVLGNERITVPAGSFDTTKVELQVTVAPGLTSGFGSGTLEILVWYSMDHKRLVRQTVNGRHVMQSFFFNRIREAMELAAFRSGTR